MKKKEYFGLIHFLLTPIEYHFPFTKIGSWVRSTKQFIEIKYYKKQRNKNDK
jgi:hypothetical protein